MKTEKPVLVTVGMFSTGLHSDGGTVLAATTTVMSLFFTLAMAIMCRCTGQPDRYGECSVSDGINEIIQHFLERFHTVCR